MIAPQSVVFVRRRSNKPPGADPLGTQLRGWWREWCWRPGVPLQEGSGSIEPTGVIREVPRLHGPPTNWKAARAFPNRTAAPSRGRG